MKELFNFYGITCNLSHRSIKIPVCVLAEFDLTIFLVVVQMKIVCFLSFVLIALRDSILRVFQILSFQGT